MTDEEEESDDDPEGDGAPEIAEQSGREARALFDALGSLPLFREGNVYLSMEARNIAIVDAHLRNLENQMMRAYYEGEGTPTMEVTIVSAMSQVWIFGLYELLRTWRQLVSQLIAYDNDLAPIRGAPDFDEKKVAIYATRRQKSKGPAHSRELAESIYGRPFRRIEWEPAFAAELQAAKDAVQPVMRRIEELRIALAKHEVRGASGVRAHAPGYARIDVISNSLVWMVVKKDGYSEMISRRSLPDDLRKAVREWCASAGVSER
jgi:hypothetical protein